jgi:hypothetical protein
VGKTFVRGGRSGGDGVYGPGGSGDLYRLDPKAGGASHDSRGSSSSSSGSSGSSSSSSGKKSDLAALLEEIKV